MAELVAHLIDKENFYHGAAMIPVIEHLGQRSVQPWENGYAINESTAIILKYSTKSRPPWRFTFLEDDVARVRRAIKHFGSCVVAFVCCGDGICGVLGSDLLTIIGQPVTWIAIRRSFRAGYRVEGAGGQLPFVVAIRDWPAIVFKSAQPSGDVAEGD